MGSRLDELIAQATSKKPVKTNQGDNKVAQKEAPVYKPHTTKVESQATETNLFDNLDEYMDGLQNVDIPPASDYAPDGLQVGDPVVGIHKRQRMSGQVIDVDRDNITVEWKNHDVSQVKADTLELSNVDDAYEEEAMYVESKEPNLGFDVESFVNDGDLESLLKGRMDESFDSTYDMNGDL